MNDSNTSASSRESDTTRTNPCDEASTFSAAEDEMAKTERLTRRAYEKQRDRIMERFAEKDVARDIVTLAGMTEIYCSDHHDASSRTPFQSEAVDAGVYPVRKIPRLCPECAAHLRYGEVRRALCRREPRPSCKTCSNHCYAPDEQAFQRKAMAYAGPRAMFRGHAVEAIRHLIQTRLS